MLNSSNAIVLTMHHAPCTMHHAPCNSLATKKTQGFTLIELSIVLVIIGLLVGGILTGWDLIKAAELTATISQITKYNTVVGTFQLKYNGYLPGDIPDPAASQFGFQARGTHPGQGDGNGLIQGYSAYESNNTCGWWQSNGETAVFWVDLSTAGLIDGGFNTANFTDVPIYVSDSSNPPLKAYFPQAKLGGDNYIYAWSGGWQSTGYPCGNSPDGNNYFSVSTINTLAPTGPFNFSITSMTVSQAYNIDKKIDDSLPQSGRVMAMYLNWNTPLPGSIAWAAGGGNFGASTGAGAPTTAATPYATTNCYDNNNVAGIQTYSLAQNANMPNCALSFQFQTR